MRKKWILKISLIWFLLLMTAVGVFAQDAVTTTSGVINNETPFVEYPLSVDAPVDVVIDIQATSGSLDTLLYLVDDLGNIVDENDDRAEGIYDSLIAYNGLPAGTYSIVATRFDITYGETEGDFTLAVDVRPAADRSLPAYKTDPASLASAGFPEIEVRPQAEWTILAYYGADNNLEQGIIDDLNEFELAGGSNEKIHIVALVDRSPDYTTSNADWTDTRLFEVTADTSADADGEAGPTIDSLELANLGERETDNGETLAQFLAWGLTHYPAQHYAIAFGSHGAGWEGVITDDSSPIEEHQYHAIVSVPELQQAFSTITQQFGVSKFDLLINDACLMSSVEYYTRMSDYFNLSFASAEIVVNPALDMTKLTTFIENPQDQDLTTFGPTLLNQYVEEDSAPGESPTAVFLTHAMTDLQQYGGVVSALDAFATLILSQPELYIDAISDARSNTYTYTAFLNFDAMVDIGHFMEQVVVSTTDGKLIEAAQAVITAVKQARLYGNAGEVAKERVHYQNIYFPQRLRDFNRAYLEESPLANWGRMLTVYYNLLTPRQWLTEDNILIYHPVVPPKVTITQVYPQVSSVVQPPTIQMEVQGRNIIRGSFTADRVQADGTAVRLLETRILTEIAIGGTVNFVNQWRDGVDQSEFSWLPLSLPAVSDGMGTYNELLIKSGDVAILEGRYRESEAQDWVDVGVMFSIVSGDVDRVISRTAGSNALADITIAPGSIFQSYKSVVTPDGRVQKEEGNLYLWQEYGLTWRETVAPSGEYNLGFLVESAGGTSGFDSVGVTIDNSNVMADTAGYNEIALGVGFEYPAEWVAPFSAEGQIITFNKESTESILVAFYTLAEDSKWRVSEQYLRNYNLQSPDAGQEVTVAGLDGIAFQYTIPRDDGGQPFVGRAFAFFQETAQLGKTGIVFAVEGADPATVEARYNQYINGLKVFDSLALRAQDTRNWQYSRLDGGQIFAVPSNWTAQPTEKGTVYTDPNNPATAVYLERVVSTDLEAVFQAALPTQAITTRQYRQGDRVWTVGNYDNNGVVGRVYATQLEDTVHTIRFEATNDESALLVYRDIFEPLVDGYAPASGLQYALGGVNPTILKAAMTRADEACSDLDVNLVCYGEGVLDAAVVAEAEADAQAFQASGDLLPIEQFNEIAVGASAAEAEAVASDEYDSFSVAIMQPEVPTALEAAVAQSGSVRMGIFGGATVVNDLVQVSEAN